MSFVEQRRFVLEPDGRPETHEQAAEGWTERRLVASPFGEGLGLTFVVEDARPVAPSYLEETRLIHVEQYMLTSTSFSPNVPAHLDRQRLSQVNALLFSARGESVGRILWSVFYELAVLPAVEDQGHWLNAHMPAFMEWHGRQAMLRRRQVVDSVMST